MPSCDNESIKREHLFTDSVMLWFGHCVHGFQHGSGEFILANVVSQGII